MKLHDLWCIVLTMAANCTLFNYFNFMIAVRYDLFPLHCHKMIIGTETRYARLTQIKYTSEQIPVTHLGKTTILITLLMVIWESTIYLDAQLYVHSHYACCQIFHFKRYIKTQQLRENTSFNDLGLSRK